MGAHFIDQGYVSFAMARELIAKSRNKLEPAGAATDDNDAMRAGRTIRDRSLAGPHRTIHRRHPRGVTARQMTKAATRPEAGPESAACRQIRA